MATNNLKHQNGIPQCLLCQQKLTQAHPDLVRWFNELVKPQFPQMHISWSFRDQVNQDQCFSDGKSKLKWPMSEHNKTDAAGNPCARALDLFMLDVNGMACWHYGDFRAVWNASSTYWNTMQWSGNWTGFIETGHYQLKPVSI